MQIIFHGPTLLSLLYIFSELALLDGLLNFNKTNYKKQAVFFYCWIQLFGVISYKSSPVYLAFCQCSQNPVKAQLMELLPKYSHNSQNVLLKMLDMNLQFWCGANLLVQLNPGIAGNRANFGRGRSHKVSSSWKPIIQQFWLSHWPQNWEKTKSPCG
jgi:hypothetical protein